MAKTEKIYKSCIVVLCWFANFFWISNGLNAQCCRNGPNLLATYNPDFSAPVVTIPPGFKTDNTYSITPGAGTYILTTDRIYGACSHALDHTSGDGVGKYLWFDTKFTASIANPQTAWTPYDPNLPAGSQNLIKVTQNTTYVFSCWVRDIARNNDCISGGAPLVGIRINGVDMEQLDLGLTTSPCCPQWTNMCVQWQSGTDTTVLLRIESRRGIGWTDLGIDDVYFGSATPLNFSLGNDTAICNGQSLMLQDSLPGATYLWSDGSTTSSLTVNTPGIYWLALSQGTCTGRDSIHVTQLFPPVASLGNDTLLCDKSSYTIAPVLSGGPPLNFLWQDNSTGISGLANSTGLYWLQVGNQCGANRDSVTLTFQANVSPFSLGDDTVLCTGASITLSPVPVPSGNFLWQDNSSGNTFPGASDGLFWLEVSTICGTYRDSIVLSSFSSVTPFSLGDDTVLCSGGSIDLSPFPMPVGNFLWQDSSNANAFYGASDGLYWLEVSGLCGTYRDSILISSFPNLTKFSLGNDTILCSGEISELCAPDTFVSYSWSTGDKVHCTGASIAGDYWVSVTATNGCATVSQREKIAFYPVPSVSIIRQGDTLSSFNAVSYQWYLDGDKITGATNSVYVADRPGNYSVGITDANGCTSISSPVIITGLNDFYDDRSFEIYPNPATKEILLKASKDFIGNKYVLYDVVGRVIARNVVSNEITGIDLSSITAGIYLVKVNACSRRFVKQ